MDKIKVLAASLVLILLLYPAQRQLQKAPSDSKQILGVATQESQSHPSRLIIPRLNVNAAVQDVGVTASGEMAVPSNAIDVGWFNLGPQPGQFGSAVIAGHFDSETGEAGVFKNLDKLSAGDKMQIINDLGATITFVVRESRKYIPGFADEVFSSNSGAHLNLITCDGAWDKVKKSYSKRLVVFADLVVDK